MEMAEAAAGAARAFVDLLDEAQADDALLPFDGEERRTWAYWPASRRGLPLWRLDRAQTKAVHRLLASLLPLPVHARVVAIMGLDEVLDRMEGYRGDRRHSEDYWVTLFGGPGEEVWGVRFEGHHVSVHASFGPDSGWARLTPIFLGANPSVVHEAGRAVLAPLAAEERLGFELLHSLSSEQRADAIVADRAPDDILTRNRPRLDDPLPAHGVPLTALDGAAAVSARALLDVYLGRFPGGALRPDPVDARFCWAGATEPGTGHYYRVAGPRLVIELDNTQNGANHVHTVVRHPLADFGDDVLAAHHRAAHAAPPGPGA